MDYLYDLPLDHSLYVHDDVKMEFDFTYSCLDSCYLQHAFFIFVSTHLWFTCYSTIWNGFKPQLLILETCWTILKVKWVGTYSHIRFPFQVVGTWTNPMWWNHLQESIVTIHGESIIVNIVFDISFLLLIFGAYLLS